jgi:hypothetical protein
MVLADIGVPFRQTVEFMGTLDGWVVQVARSRIWSITTTTDISPAERLRRAALALDYVGHITSLLAAHFPGLFDDLELPQTPLEQLARSFSERTQKTKPTDA